jgi:hypothetical protein
MARNFKIWQIIVLATICIFISFESALADKKIEKNAVLEKLAMCRPVPEYNRFLKKVVISISCAETNLDLHEGILSCLPKYTEIYLLLPRLCLDSIRNWIADKAYKNQIRFVAYDPEKMISEKVYLLYRDKAVLEPCDLNEHYFYKHFGTIWAQDLFEVSVDQNGREVLLSSDTHRYYSGGVPTSNTAVVPDNGYLGSLSALNMEVFRFPLAFKGGNVLFDEIGGKIILYVGGDTYKTTKAIWNMLYGENPSNGLIEAMIKKMLSADEIVSFYPEKQQPCSMYHLDQAMVILPNKHVGIARIINTGPDDQIQCKKTAVANLFLSSMRLQMQKLGYKILDIEMTSSSLLNFRHNVNVIPYIDAETGRRALLMPIFESECDDLESAITEKNKQTFESIGFTVIPVRTKSHEFKGGLHCLINVVE